MSISVGVIGLGVGEKHVEAYQELEATSVKSVFDLDRKQAEHIGKKYNCKVAESYSEILEDSDIKIVSIASFDDAHYEEVLAAFDAGKHIFVEKPLCRTEEELKKVVSAWRKHNGSLKLFSNLILRSAPLYIWLKREIESGGFGEIYSFDCDYLYGRINKITEDWRKDVDNYSVMEGGGVHMIDLMLWLTGQRPGRVATVGNRICTKDTAFRYNDFMSATLEFSSGLIGRVTANFGCVHEHHHIMRIFGTEATFIYDDQGARVHRTRVQGEKPEMISLCPLQAHKGRLIPEFVQAVENNTNFDKRTQEIFDGISVCAASDEALVSGEKKEIEYA